jgi:LysR family transcriptional regulator, transcriptional activator of nhaA
MTWLNYHHLYYFKNVVDHGSIAKASEALRIGQPGISMQIKALEEFLGKTLFERKNKKLILTETGQVVYEYAQEIFNLGTEMITTLNDRAYNHIKIQIGIQSSVPKNLVSKITSYIYENFNSVISVYNGSIEEVTMGVVSHKLDIAILNYPPIIKDKTILFSKRILSSPIVMAGSKKFLHLKNKPLQNFSSVPLILPTSQVGLRQMIEQHFNNHGMQMNMVGEAEDTIVQKNMAISGNGIVPIMKDAIDTYVKTKQLFILKELPELQDEIWLVAGKRQIANPIGNKLITDFKF